MSSPPSPSLRAAVEARDWPRVFLELSELSSLEERCRRSPGELLEDFAWVLRRAPAPLPPEERFAHPSGARLDRRALLVLESTIESFRSALQKDPGRLFPLLYNELYWYDAPERAAHCDRPLPAGPGLELWRLMESWRASFEARPGAAWLRSLRPPAALRAELPGWRIDGGGPVLSADGGLLLVKQSRSPRELRLLDARTGLLKHSFPVSYDGGGLFSSDGRHILVFTERSAWLWDAASRTPLRPFGPLGDELRRAAFSQDDREAIVASLKEVSAWRVADGARLAARPSGGEIKALLPAGEGRVLIHRSKGWALWDYLRDEIIAAQDTSGYLYQAALSPAGDRLLSFDGSALEGWSLPEGRRLFQRPFTDQMNGLAFHPDGASFAAACWNTGAARLYDASTGEERGVIPGPGSWAISFDPTGRFLLSCSGGSSLLWELEASAVYARAASGAMNGSASWSRDGRSLAIGAGEATFRYDLDLAWPTPPWRDDARAAAGRVHFSPSGGALVVEHRDGLSFWDVERATARRFVATEQIRPIADGRAILCRHDGMLVALSTEDGEEIFRISLPGDRIRAVFLAEGFILANTQNGLVVAWRAEDGAERYRLSGSILAQSGGYFWLKTPGGELSVRELGGAALGSIPSTEGRRFCLSPDRRRLAVYGFPDRGEQVEVWDLPSGALLHTLRATDWNVQSVRFTEDGGALATTTWRMENISDGFESPTECLFDLSSGALLSEQLGPMASDEPPDPSEPGPGLRLIGGALHTPDGAVIPLPERLSACREVGGAVYLAGEVAGRVALYRLHRSPA